MKKQRLDVCRWDERKLSGKQTDFCSPECGKKYHNSRFMRPQDRKIQRELACLDALPVPQRRVELMRAAYKFGLLK
jgi:hypothetical protein